VTHELGPKTKAAESFGSGAALRRTDPEANALLGGLEQAALPAAGARVSAAVPGKQVKTFFKQGHEAGILS